ncbi:Deoxycytidylate deaminase [Ophiocordyceps camponoti-floridani]|uniref:Deoxycytidylate deaminase n=1 Tax=Ophiocordyceps camponoti-floridani TaxID=2030778 RepID=A0A8H4VF48_9HYPO|nr:Deoxycytidylate deaminase [Ophiocordyceps camponoti-floridani]
MLIGVCGGICSGKKTVASYLVAHHGFKQLHLRDDGGGDASPDPTDTGRGTDGSASDFPGALTVRSGAEPATFATAEALLDYVTRRWQDRFVISDLQSEVVVDVLARRPFFLLLSVEAPVMVRWRRLQERTHTDTDLQDFVAVDDADLYDAVKGQQPLISRATVRLLNTSKSLDQLHASLDKLQLSNPDRLRPGWDTYFMALASLAAQRSNCMKRRVGCVIVGREHGVISTGYNGTPRGLRNCASGGCRRCNDGNGAGVALSTCLCIHAEENALLEAGRERIRPGAVLYCDTCPCLTCSIKICQVGIAEVVYARDYSMDSATAAVFAQAGVSLRQFTPPHTGLVHLERMELYS